MDNGKIGGPAVADHRLTGARSRYAREWSFNAQRFHEDGLYRWMTHFLPPGSVVLEVGTGEGSGTAAMVAAGHAVIGVDENPVCLRLAKERLLRADLPVICESRESLQPDGDRYRIRYSAPVSLAPHRGALLLEGDALNDPTLIGWLLERPVVDAVACWLMGTYFERIHNDDISRLAIRNPGDYRERVHRALCGMANDILPRGGTLHFVDRGDLPGSRNDTERYRAYYCTLAAGTALALESLAFRRYREPVPDGAAIRLTATEGDRDPDAAQTALVSTVFRKY